MSACWFSLELRFLPSLLGGSCGVSSRLANHPSDPRPSRSISFGPISAWTLFETRTWTWTWTGTSDRSEVWRGQQGGCCAPRLSPESRWGHKTAPEPNPLRDKCERMSPVTPLLPVQHYAADEAAEGTERLAADGRQAHNYPPSSFIFCLV